MIHEIQYKQPKQVIEKEGEPKFIGESTAKCMRTWIQGRINICMKRNLSQEEFFFRQVLNAYNHYHPMKQTEVEIEGWHGKSSFDIIKNIDSLTIIKYQKKDKDSEPVEIRTEVTKQELNAIIHSLKKLSMLYESIETRDIAREYCNYLNITKNDKDQYLFKGDFWTNFFGWRTAHNKLTLILSALEHLKLIEYKAGKTKLLNNKIDIQLLLNH